VSHHLKSKNTSIDENVFLTPQNPTHPKYTIMRFLTYPDGGCDPEWIAHKLNLPSDDASLDVHFDSRVITLFMSDARYSFRNRMSQWDSEDDYRFSAECYEVPDGTVVRFTHGEESGCEYFEIDQAATRIGQMRALGEALTLDKVKAILDAPPITAVEVIPWPGDE
jgi:hypothetical protein